MSLQCFRRSVPLPLTPMASEGLSKKDAGDLIQKRRAQAGLTQDQLADLLGVDKSYISKLEGGVHGVRGSKYFPGLAEILKLSEEDIRAINPSAIFSLGGEATPRRSGSPIPPVVEPLDLPLEIPDELQQVIDQYGKDYPELHNERTLRALTAIRREVGSGYGPQTPGDWFEVFVTNRRWFPK